MNNESDVKKEIKKFLDPFGPDLWYFMPSANGYGTPGVPDFVGTYRGRMFTIETKFGTGKQTQWQLKQMMAIVATGAPYWLVNEKNMSEFCDMFTMWAATAGNK